MTRSLAIAIDGIELRGRCGVTVEERSVGQTLVVDVRIEPASCRGAETDEIDGTVDYARIVDIVFDVVRRDDYKLLERLATVIAEALWDAFEPAALKVNVAKVAPPVAIPVTAARVEVSLAR